MENYSCSLDHPIYDLLSNKTRLEILRMIACEHNYGSRIASLLGISAPAIHRHLKFLSQLRTDPNGLDFFFIKEMKKTKESYSGYKGAEATHYEIGTKMYLSFALYPNFMQSHSFLEDAEGNISAEITDDSLKGSFIGTDGTDSDKNENIEYKKAIKRYSSLFKRIQKKNSRIKELEAEIMDILDEKNDLMKKMDHAIMNVERLSFDERVSLRLLACQGPICIPNLPELLKQDVNVTMKNLKVLEKNGWFAQFDEEILAEISRIIG
jgi:predicted transcriptional regulator